MGTIRNQVVIIHHYDKTEITKLREDAVQYFQAIIVDIAAKNGYRLIDTKSIVTPILESFINSEYTFFINGDCSKIGWPESDQFKKARMKWIEENKYNAQNIVLVDLGEDYPAKILFDSTLEIRDEE